MLSLEISYNYWMNMQSGAAQVLAPKIAAGMIFVPSIGGISHDFNEDTAGGIFSWDAR
jgi:hypothetical protein